MKFANPVFPLLERLPKSKRGCFPVPADQGMNSPSNQYFVIAVSWHCNLGYCLENSLKQYPLQDVSLSN
jgi:hypothetical protein